MIPTMRPRAGLLACLFMTLAAGCHSWHTADPASSASDGRQRWQVWVHGEPHVVHGLRTAGDSVSGVPYWRNPACDTCRVTWPRTAIDSARVERLSEGRSAAFGLTTFVVFISSIFIWSAITG